MGFTIIHSEYTRTIYTPAEDGCFMEQYQELMGGAWRNLGSPERCSRDYVVSEFMECLAQ